MVAVEVAERRMETHQLTLLKLISRDRHLVDHDLPLRCKSISMACRNGSSLFPTFSSASILNYTRASMERFTTSKRIAIEVLTRLHAALPQAQILVIGPFYLDARSPRTTPINEAVKAATHFGNTTQTPNLNDQYVIVSATGTHPDGFNTASGAFCAWHDWNGDPFVGVTSPYGDIAFTNMPYVTDLGASCGENFVNAGTAGLQDGISIVNGHEYAETITDQNPAGGWTDSSGAENADKCAWITPGTSGGSFDLTLATGTFAMQTTWANDGAAGAGACEASHPIVTNGTATTATP